MAGSELFQRRFKNIAQSPLGPDKKLTTKGFAGVLDYDKTRALFAVCANRMFA